MVDAKNQKKVFTYDSYNRVTQVQRYVYSGGSYVEDPMQRTNFYFDSNPFGTSTYVSGRLAAVQYYDGHSSHRCWASRKKTPNPFASIS